MAHRTLSLLRVFVLFDRGCLLQKTLPINIGKQLGTG